MVFVNQTFSCQRQRNGPRSPLSSWLGVEAAQSPRRHAFRDLIPLPSTSRPCSRPRFSGTRPRLSQGQCRQRREVKGLFRSDAHTPGRLSGALGPPRATPDGRHPGAPLSCRAHCVHGISNPSVAQRVGRGLGLEGAWQAQEPWSRVGTRGGRSRFPGSWFPGPGPRRWGPHPTSGAS